MLQHATRTQLTQTLHRVADLTPLTALEKTQYLAYTRNLTQQSQTALVTSRAYRQQLQDLCDLADAAILAETHASAYSTMTAQLIPQIPDRHPFEPMVALADAPRTTGEIIRTTASRITNFAARELLAGGCYAGRAILDAAQVAYQHPKAALTLVAFGAFLSAKLTYGV